MMGDLKKIGGLWLKDGKKGKFFSGEIETKAGKVSVFVFKNNLKKEGEKTPDYQVFETGSQAAPAKPAAPQKPAPQDDDLDISEENVPF